MFAFHYFTSALILWIGNWDLFVCFYVCFHCLLFVYFFACEQFHCLFFCLTLWDSRSSSSVRGSLEECLIWKSLKMSVNTRQDENCTFWWKSGCGKKRQNQAWTVGQGDGGWGDGRNAWFESLSSWTCLTVCQQGKRQECELLAGGTSTLKCKVEKSQINW